MHAREFLGLQATHNPHRWYLPVERKLCTREGFLFGGCGLAAAVTALEATTGRPLVWATAQYLSYARTPSVLDLDVIVPVAGRNSTQARAIGHVGDQEIFTVNAALGSRSLDIAGQWAQMPAVPDPQDCPRAPALPTSAGTIHDQVELRVARGRYGPERDGTPSPDGRSALWIRLPRELDRSAAGLAIVADWVPSGIGQALGRWAGGTSLDNTVRILDVAPTDWVLCDIKVHGIAKGFGHGRVHLWSESGRLMATGNQSLIVRLHDERAQRT
jgi:acyl-CoA thioesterase-2